MQSFTRHRGRVSHSRDGIGIAPGARPPCSQNYKPEGKTMFKAIDNLMPHLDDLDFPTPEGEHLESLPTYLCLRCGEWSIFAMDGDCGLCPDKGVQISINRNPNWKSIISPLILDGPITEEDNIIFHNRMMKVLFQEEE